jgi:hypothetical protein
VRLTRAPTKSAKLRSLARCAPINRARLFFTSLRALPAGWEDWILSEAAARACPPDYVAGALIGAASGWTGNSRRIAATADWIEPAHLWFVVSNTQ